MTFEKRPSGRPWDIRSLPAEEQRRILQERHDALSAEITKIKGQLIHGKLSEQEKANLRKKIELHNKTLGDLREALGLRRK
jgi:hypothetical protein